MKEDVSCVTDEANCYFKLYEKKRMKHLSEALSKAREAWEIHIEMKDGVAQTEIEKANKLIDYISTLTESLENAITRLEANPSERLLTSYLNLSWHQSNLYFGAHRCRSRCRSKQSRGEV